MNQDSLLDYSNKMRRFDIVLKMIQDDIVQGIDKIDKIELNNDVMGLCYGIGCITCKN